MAIVRPKEARKMDAADKQKKMAEFRLELAKERANIAIGANVTSPGKIKELRRSIARILTTQNQMGGISK